MVLKVHKVDIVTSNPILAKWDAEESEEIYKKFDITVGNNIEDGANLFNSYEKQCYTKDVVYGTTFEYQADILRDEYELINVRNKRHLIL
jgi:preprotein translocase subunit SecA